jgi:hypothetical protein
LVISLSLFGILFLGSTPHECFVESWINISSAVYAIRNTFRTTLKATPVKLVLGRDMALSIKFIADWGTLEQQRQKEMARNNRRENVSRISHDYKVADKVLLKKLGKHLRKPRSPWDRTTHSNCNIH